MISKNDKDKIIVLIVASVTEHPEWLGDIVQAMQYGLSQALFHEREQASDLAMGLVTMIQWEQDKNKKFPYYHNIQKGLKTLRNWFETAPVWKQIECLIEGDDNE